MSRTRLTVVLLAVTAATISSGCGKLLGGSNPTSPSGGGGGGGAVSATFTPDDGVRFTGAQPAPLVANGMVYVYQNTANDGVMVQASSDELTFAQTPATYPAGVSRSIVTLPDGRFRMYYFPDGTSVDVRSAVSSNGLNWTAEAGVRYSESGIGGLRATALPTGGCRLYFVNSASSISSATSSDGLAFVSEGQIAIPAPDGTFTWGPSAAVNLNGEFHMVLTKVPSSGVSEFWYGVSTDGRNWNVSRSFIAANPGVPINQPAWAVNGNTRRVYYRAQPSAGVNAVASGTIRF